MSPRAWVRLDNASNIFLAARTASDTKVFRFSAELDHEVDPVLLQEALEVTFDRYPLYHAVLRAGVFWYYLQDSDLRPTVQPDLLPPCAPIYQVDRRNLLFRVVHHGTRVSLEVFHALSDGTGALWFLTDLLEAYSRLRFPAEAPRVPGGTEPLAAEVDAHPAGDAEDPVHDLSTDAFASYFRRRRGVRRQASGADQLFDRAAVPGPLSVADPTAGEPDTAPARPAPRRRRLVSAGRVHRVRGTRTPDHRSRVVELSMPATEVIALAKAEGATLTMFLVALFFEAVRRTSGELGRHRTLSVSVPVNLRQFFPSTSARNFFATVRLEHTYGRGEAEADSVAAVARTLEESFAPQVTAAALGEKLHTLISFEQAPAARVVPRPLKDLLLGLANRANNRGLSVAISNMGRVRLPEPAQSHVRRMYFHVAAARPQFCSISHAGLLTISFTSPFVETDHVREFACLLTERGVDVTAAVTRVTEDEIAGARG